MLVICRAFTYIIHKLANQCCGIAVRLCSSWALESWRSNIFSSSSVSFTSLSKQHAKHSPHKVYLETSWPTWVLLYPNKCSIVFSSHHHSKHSTTQTVSNSVRQQSFSLTPYREPSSGLCFMCALAKWRWRGARWLLASLSKQRADFSPRTKNASCATLLEFI